MITECSRWTRSALWLSSLGGLTLFVPYRTFAQDPTSNLGLPAVAAIGLHAGIARLERQNDGFEAGALMDLGWLRGRSLRLVGEVAILRATLSEFVEIEDSTFQGDYFDLSVGITALWLATPEGPVSPYVLAGTGVHALSSTFGVLQLDRRYNVNRFGSHIGGGLRVRLGASGRTALYAEWRRVIADEVNRSVIRFGGLALLGDLARPRH